MNATVVAYDPRGYGDSVPLLGSGTPRSPNTITTTTILDHLYDGERVMEYVQRQDWEGLPVYVWGHSLGGPQAMHLAKRFSPLVSGVILESTFPSLEDAACDYPILFPLWWLPRPPRLTLVRKCLDLCTQGQLKHFNTVELLTKGEGSSSDFNNLKILVLHGSGDLQLPCSFAGVIGAAATSSALVKGRVKVHVVRGGGHSNLHVDFQEELEGVLTEWLKI